MQDFCGVLKATSPQRAADGNLQRFDLAAAGAGRMRRGFMFRGGGKGPGNGMAGGGSGDGWSGGGYYVDLQPVRYTLLFIKTCMLWLRHSKACTTSHGNGAVARATCRGGGGRFVVWLLGQTLTTSATLGNCNISTVGTLVGSAIAIEPMCLGVM